MFAYTVFGCWLKQVFKNSYVILLRMWNPLTCNNLERFVVIWVLWWFVSARFGMIRPPIQRPGSWTPQKGRTEREGDYRDAISPSPTNTCSQTDASLKVAELFYFLQYQKILSSPLCLSASVLIIWPWCLILDPVKPPLSFLFEDKTHSSFSSTVKDKATSEAIRYYFLL